MSAEVDTRVVQLTFDNEQFQKGVEDSLKSLDKLSKNIDELPKSAKSFEELNSAMNSLDDKGLNNIDAHLEKITDRLSTMGIIGASAINKITSTAMNVAAGALGVVLDPIKQIFVGGLTRAQNLAQAQFLLAGMGIEDWKEEIEGVSISMEHLTEEEKALGQTTDSIFKDIDYAVSGTAYGLDEAAKVAAQFVASGLEAGDQMRGALRGISGVAAMTNSSFQEIGDIFTKVAAKGKAMTLELNQLSGRGLNGAAAIARYLTEVEGIANVTEREVYEMAKSSEISFDIFANAMDYAFGEHAKAANNTFVGALANTRAALSRVGEQFWTPVMESARKILVAVIPVINNLKNSLAPFFTFVTSGIDMISDAIVGLLNLISSIGAPIAAALKNISNSMSDSIASFRNNLGGIFSIKTTKKTEAPINKLEKSITTLIGDPSKMSNKLKNMLSERGYSVEEPLEKAAKSMEKSANSSKISAGKASKAAKSAAKSNKETAKSYQDIIDSSPEIQIKAGKLEDTIENLSKVTGVEKSALKDLAETAKKSGWDSKDTLEKLNKISNGNKTLAEQIKAHLGAAGNNETVSIKYIDAVIDNLSKTTKIEKKALYDLLKTAAEKGWSSKELLEKATELAKGDKKLAKTLLEELKAGAEAKTATLEETIKNVATVAGKDKSEVEKIVKLATEKGWESTEVLEEAKKLANGNEDLAKQMLMHLQVAQDYGNDISKEVANASSAGGAAIGGAGGAAIEVEEDIDEATNKTKENIEDAYKSIIKTEDDVLSKYEELSKKSAEELKSFLELKNEDPELYKEFLKNSFNSEKELKEFDSQIDNMKKELFHVKELSEIADKMNNMSADEENKYRKILNLSAEDTEQVMFMRAKSVTDTAESIDEVSNMLSRITGKEAEAFTNLSEVGRKYGFDSEEYLSSLNSITKDLTTNTEEFNDILTNSIELVSANPLQRLALSLKKVSSEVGNTFIKFIKGFGNVGTAITKTVVSPVTEAIKKIKDSINNDPNSNGYKFVDALTNKFLKLSTSIKGLGDKFIGFTEKLIPSQKKISERADKIVKLFNKIDLLQFGRNIKNIFKSISDLSIFTKIGDGFKTVGRGIKEMFTTGFEKLGQKIDKFIYKLTHLKETFSELKNTKLYKNIKSGFDNVKTSVNKTVDSIKNIDFVKKATDNVTTGWNNFSEAVQKNEAWEWLTTKVDDVKNKFDSFVKWLKGTGITTFFSGMFDAIKSKFSPFTNAISEDYEKLKNKLTDGEGIAGLIKNIGEEFGKLKEKIINFKFPTFDEFIEDLNKLETNFSSFFTNTEKTGLFDKIGNMFSESSFLKTIKDHFDAFIQTINDGTEKAGGASENVKSFLEKAKTNFDEFIDWIKRSFEGKNAYEVARAIASLGILFAFFRVLWELGDFIDVGSQTLYQSLGDAKKRFLGIKIQSLLSSIGDAFLKIGVVMFAFSKSTPEEIQNAKNILVLVGGYLLVAYSVLGVLSKLGGGIDPRSIAVSTTALSAGIFLMAQAILQFKKISWDDFIENFKKVTLIAVTLAGSTGLMTLGPHSFSKSASSILALVGGLYLMEKVIKKFYELDDKEFEKGFERANKVIIALAAGVRGLRINIAALFWSLANETLGILGGNTDGKTIVQPINNIAATLLALMGSLYIMSHLIKKYADIDDSVFTKGTSRVLNIASSLVGLVGSLQVMAIVSSSIGNALGTLIGGKSGKNSEEKAKKSPIINNLKGIAALMLSIAAATLIIAPAVSFFGNLDEKVAKQGILSVMGLFVSIGIMLAAIGAFGMSENVRKNTILEVFGLGILLTAVAALFWLIGSWDVDKLSQASKSIAIMTGAMAVLSAALGVANYLSGKGGIDPKSFGLLLTGMIVILGGMMGLLYIMKDFELNQVSNILDISKGISLIIVSIAGCIALLSKFSEISEGQFDTASTISLFAGFGVLIAGIGFALSWFAGNGGSNLSEGQIHQLTVAISSISIVSALIFGLYGLLEKFEMVPSVGTLLKGIITGIFVIGASALILSASAKYLDGVQVDYIKLATAIDIIGLGIGAIAGIFGVIGSSMASVIKDPATLLLSVLTAAAMLVAIGSAIGITAVIWNEMNVGSAVSNLIDTMTNFLDPLATKIGNFGRVFGGAVRTLKGAFTNFKIDSSVITTLKDLFETLKEISKDATKERIVESITQGPFSVITRLAELGSGKNSTSISLESTLDTIQKMGEALKTFSEGTKSIDNPHLTEYVKNIVDLVSIEWPDVNELTNVRDYIFLLEDLADGFVQFSKSLYMRGEAKYDERGFEVIGDLEELDIDYILKVTEAIKNLAESPINGEDSLTYAPVDQFVYNLETLGDGIIDFYKKMNESIDPVDFSNSSGVFQTSLKIIEKLANITIKEFDRSLFGIIANNTFKEFGEGISGLGTGLATFLTEITDGLSPLIEVVGGAEYDEKGNKLKIVSERITRVDDTIIACAEAAIDLISKLASIDFKVSDPGTVLNNLAFSMTNNTISNHDGKAFAQSYGILQKGIIDFVKAIDKDLPVSVTVAESDLSKKIENTVSIYEKLASIDIPDNLITKNHWNGATIHPLQDFAKQIPELATGIINFVEEAKKLDDIFVYARKNIYDDEGNIIAVGNGDVINPEESPLFKKIQSMLKIMDLIGSITPPKENFSILKAIAGIDFGKGNYEKFGSQMATLGKGLADFSKEVKELDYDETKVTNAMHLLGLFSAKDESEWNFSFLDRAAKVLTDTATPFITAYADFVYEMKEQLKTKIGGDGTTKVIDGLKNAFGTLQAISDLFSGKRADKEEGFDISKARQIGSALSNIGTGLKDISEHGIKDFVDAFDGGISGLQSKYSLFYDCGVTIGSKTIDGFHNAIYIGVTRKGTGTGKSFQQEITDLSDNIKTWLDPIATQFEDFGGKIVDGICRGFATEEKVTLIKESGQKLGYNLGKGLVEGIKKMFNEVGTISFNLTSNAVEQAAEGEESKSPSKATERLGVYFGEGFIVGMKSTFSDVSSMAYDLGKEGIDSVSQAIADIANDDYSSLSMDLSPVITPTLDLSSVNASANQMVSLFKDQQIAIQNAQIEADMKLTNQLAGAFDQLERPNVTNNVTVDGAENPNLWAQSFVNTMRREMRMANG